MSNFCAELHALANELKIFTFPYNPQEIPLNGIYILFEKGEQAHSTHRIVGIGTHTGNDNLSKRLIEHFLTENKNRSILRQHLGRVFLTKENDSYFPVWNDNTTSPKSKYFRRVDKQKENEVEKRVSNYIQENLSFAVFAVEDEIARSILVKKMISTVASCEYCKPSPNWLGNNSPNKTIRNYGLWQIQHVKKFYPLSEQDMQFLRQAGIK